MKKRIFIGILLFVNLSVFAQDVLFTNYLNTPLQTNPALVAFDNDFKLQLNYRGQNTGLNQNYQTPLFSVVYPLINQEKTQRWGGLGFSLITDIAGDHAMIKTTGANFSFAYNFSITKMQFISASLAAGYFRRELNTTGLTTGSQYLPNQGFDPAASLNESLNAENKGFFDLSSGIIWQLADGQNEFPKAFFGFSAFHLTEPDIGLNEIEDALPLRFGIQLGYKVFSNNKTSIFPDLSFDYQQEIYRYNAGVNILVPLKSSEGNFINDASIIFKPRYLSNQTISIGLEFRKPSYVFAFAYDFNVSDNTISNLTDAYEIYVGFKKTLMYRPKEKKKIIVDDQYIVGEERALKQRKESIIVKDTVYVQDSAKVAEKEWSEKLSDPQRKITFQYKSAEIDKEAAVVLDEIINYLKNNTDYVLEIEGHTDNIGTEKENLRRSLKRAKAIKDYMLAKGIDADRIKVSGKGESKPLAPNDTEEGRALNRRVEFILYRIVK